MISIKNHKIGLFLSTILLLYTGYKGFYIIALDPVTAAGWLFTSFFLVILIIALTSRLIELETIRFKAIIVMSKINKDLGPIMDKSLNQMSFRDGFATALQNPNVCKIYKHTDGITLLLDFPFPDKWSKNNLIAALAWFTACMPNHVTCRYAERKEQRLVFSFVTRHGLKSEELLKLALTRCYDRLSFVLLKKVKPIHWQLLENEIPEEYQKHQSIEPPKKDQSKSIWLETEKCFLVLGNENGKFYTYFTKDEISIVGEKRMYNNWNECWQVWKHLAEVKSLFVKPSEIK